MEACASLWRNRGLLYTLIRRDVIGRYRGSLLGVLWSFLNPLLMLAVYTVVFGLVFGSRWPAYGSSRVDFALVLFAGLLVFNIFSESVNRASGLILGHANFVKKIVFPIEILPMMVLGTALFHGAVSLAVWLVVFLVFRGVPPASALLLPLVLLPLLLFTMGVTWLLAALGVYLRDVGQLVGIATTALLFLSPVFYPAVAMPGEFRWLLIVNPLTPAVEATRGLLLAGALPDWSTLAGDLALGAAFAWLGFAWFQKTRRGFADVL